MYIVKSKNKNQENTITLTPDVLDRSDPNHVFAKILKQHQVQM